MININIGNGDLINGLVERVLTKIFQKKLGIISEIDSKDISVVMDGANTKIHLDLDISMPTSQLEKLIKKHLF